MERDDLISVLVISYNSSKTILETLNSVKDQDYKNLELIVSDDSSTDDTLEVVRDWVDNNRSRFAGVKISRTRMNSGIPANMNNGMKSVGGKWVKLIAADDILLPSCISDNVDFIKESENEIRFLYSKIRVLRSNGNVRVLSKIDEDEYRYMRYLSGCGSEKQYKKLLKRDIILSPTLFMLKDAFFAIGCADESVPLIEDWPLRMRITKMGYRLSYMDKYTVLRRLHDSVSQSSIYFYNADHTKNKKQLKRQLCYPNIPWYHIVYYLNEGLADFRNFIIIKLLKNKRSFISVLIHKASFVFSLDAWSKTFYKLILRVQKFVG
jgi:glycosyltransferase involved in cell wall biosynthesis